MLRTCRFAAIVLAALALAISYAYYVDPPLLGVAFGPMQLLELNVIGLLIGVCAVAWRHGRALPLAIAGAAAYAIGFGAQYLDGSGLGHVVYQALGFALLVGDALLDTPREWLARTERPYRVTPARWPRLALG